MIVFKGGFSRIISTALTLLNCTGMRLVGGTTWRINKGEFLYFYINTGFMGLIYAAIEIINGYDLENARRHIIGDEEVKRMNINMLVDNGSLMLCINEVIQEQLQFPTDEKRKAETADGSIAECEVVKGVELRFKNRKTTCRAMVLPGSSEPLLGLFL